MESLFYVEDVDLWENEEEEWDDEEWNDDNDW